MKTWLLAVVAMCFFGVTVGYILSAHRDERRRNADISCERVLMALASIFSGCVLMWLAIDAHHVATLHEACECDEVSARCTCDGWALGLNVHPSGGGDDAHISGPGNK